MDTKPLLREVEALRVAPHETIILRLPSSFGEFAAEVAEALNDAGLRGRSLVIVSDESLEAYVVDTSNVREATA